MSVAIVTVNLLSIVLFIKNCSLRTRVIYLVINLTIADMFVGGFSHFSLFVTRLYLLDIVQFPHLKLLNPGTDINNWRFLFVLFPLTSLTNIAVISLDQMHATIRPIQPLGIASLKRESTG